MGIIFHYIIQNKLLFRNKCVLLQHHNLQLQHELGVLRGKEEKQEEKQDDSLEEERRGMRRSSPDGREGEGAVQFTMRCILHQGATILLHIFISPFQPPM